MVFQKAVFLVMSLSISHHFKMSYFYMWFKGVVGGFEIKTCLFPFCGIWGSRLVPWYFRLLLHFEFVLLTCNWRCVSWILQAVIILGVCLEAKGFALQLFVDLHGRRTGFDF